jgi:dihydroorotase
MNPPLRSAEDRDALVEGLRDGTIDAIATDHAPHDAASKALPFAQAPFGIVGLETLLPLALRLYYNGVLSLREVLAKLTCNPARIINEPAGRLRPGARADLVVIDLDAAWTLDVTQLASKSHNSPFDGWDMRGRVLRTVVAGNTVYTYRGM